MSLAIHVPKSRAPPRTTGLPCRCCMRMSFNSHSASPGGGLVSIVHGAASSLCGSHQEGAAALAEKLLCPPLWPRPVCSDFSRQNPWAAWAWPCLPGPSGTLSFSCRCLFCLLQTCFCGRKRSISNLLSTVTKQPLVYSSPVGGRDGRGELGFQTRGGRALPAPLPGMLTAGGESIAFWEWRGPLR